MTVAGIGLVVTGVLVWLTAAADTHTEHRLLESRVREAALVISEIVPTIETRLETVAATADATGANATKVGAYASRDLSTSKGGLFQSLSVWEQDATGWQEVLSWGRPPQLAADGSRLDALLSSVPGPDELAISSLLSSPHPAIACAVVSVGTTPRYAVYGEVPISPSKRSKGPTTSAFAHIDFAIYLGRRPITRDLLTSTAPMPLEGPTASAIVPFGLGSMDFVATATAPLAGGLLPALPWIIGFGGAALTIAALVMTEWLIRRRRVAERLARENHRLYAEQRSISQALQSALLPKQLPEFAGIDIQARYLAGEAAADVGGDWYDVMACDDRSFIFAIGDVSGRGVAAANTMASLHYAIRAYAAQGDDAPTILHKLGSILDIGADGHMATVLLGHVDVPRREVTLFNAGHLPPLLVAGDDAQYVPTAPGAPVGVDPGASYAPVSVTVPHSGTVLVYTDGLVERRGEILDAGLQRLRLAASSAPEAPSGTAAHNGTSARSLIDAVVAQLLTDTDAYDDVALLAMHWTA